jgi:hypothetical protein
MQRVKSITTFMLFSSCRLIGNAQMQANWLLPKLDELVKSHPNRCLRKEPKVKAADSRDARRTLKYAVAAAR